MFDLIWLFLIESCFQDQGDLNIGQGCCGLGGEGHSLLKYECGYYNLMTAAAAPAEALLHTTNYWQYTAVTVKCPPPYMIEIQTQETKEFELKKNTPFVYYLTYVYVVLPKNSMDILNYTSLYFTKLKENEWLICIYSWKSKHPIIQTLSIHKQTSGVWSFLLVLTIHCLFLRRIFDFLLIFTTFFYFFHSCTESSNISKKTFYLGAWMVVNELVNEY